MSTVSDEAFALLLIMNNYDCWMDIHTQGKADVSTVSADGKIRNKSFSKVMPK